MIEDIRNILYYKASSGSCKIWQQKKIVVYLRLHWQLSHNPQLLLYLQFSGCKYYRKGPIVACKKGRKSSIPKTHGTTSLASYTLNLDRERVCLYYTTLMASHMIFRILHSPIRCIGSYDFASQLCTCHLVNILYVSHVRLGIILAHLKQRRTSWSSSRKQPNIWITKIFPKLDEAISSANKGDRHIYLYRLNFWIINSRTNSSLNTSMIN